MLSLTHLIQQFLPASLVSGFKYSHIAREQGAYRNALLGYEPYLGAHEPPNRTLTSRRARVVYDRVMAAKNERVAEISAFLRRTGLEPAANPEAWDAIGRWMIETVEGSREPGSDRYHPLIQDYPGRPPSQIDGESTTTLRPLWESIVLDLSFLVGEHMISRAASARWSFDGEWREGSCAGDPRVAITVVKLADGDISPLQTPFRSIRAAALHCLHRHQGFFRDTTPFHLGDLLRDASNLPQQPYNPRQEFIASLEDYLDEHGDLPEEDEIAERMIDAGLTEMPELPSRLEAILDERDQHAGRTGTKDAWRLTWRPSGKG